MSSLLSPPIRAADGTRLFFVDLALGSWRPRSAAHDLAMQLGLPLPEIGAGADAPGAIASRGVDIEARGDAVICTAATDARFISQALPEEAVIAIVPPRYRLPCRSENEWFLAFLQRRGRPLRVIAPIAGAVAEGTLAGLTPLDYPFPRPPGADEARTAALLRFFPGLLPLAFLQQVPMPWEELGLVRVSETHALIPPHRRDRLPEKARAEIDRLAAFESADPGLYAFCQYFGNSLFVDSTALASFAFRAFAAGGSDLALDLLARARANARTATDAALVDLYAQGVRIFHHRFEEVAALADPAPRVPEPLRLELARYKAWGKVMVGRLDEAEALLAQPLARLAQRHSPEPDDLYLLNIYALGRLRAGDIEGAFRLERQIEAVLSGSIHPDERIVFINAINLARLHRRRGDAAGYTRYIERAFRTSAGARSSGECLQLNAMTAAAHVREDREPARFAWLRAALFWLAIDPPEGLGLRVVRAILGNDSVRRTELDARISEALEARLKRAFPHVDPASAAETVPILDGEDDLSSAPAAVFGGNGAHLLWSPERAWRPPPSGPRLSLACYLHAIMAKLYPAVGKLPCGTWIVSSNLGMDIPADYAGAMTLALRTRARRLLSGEESFVIDAEARRRLAGELTVALSPAVASVADRGESTNVDVIFRRYLAPRRLGGAQVSVARRLTMAERPLTLGKLASDLRLDAETAERLVREMEAARVVRAEWMRT